LKPQAYPQKLEPLNLERKKESSTKRGAIAGLTYPDISLQYQNVNTSDKMQPPVGFTSVKLMKPFGQLGRASAQG
jgi:hypothetical protein